MTFTPKEVLIEREKRAMEVYDRLVAPVVRPEDDGKFVAVALEADDFEIGRDEYDTTERLRRRCPGANVWLMRVGKLPAHNLYSPDVLS